MANNENINEYKELHARMKQKIDTTSHWQEVEDTFAPLKGEIIIYQDTIEENGETKTISKIKIGAEDDQGNKILLKDLPFIYVEGVTPEQLPVAVFNYDDFPTKWYSQNIVDASNAGKAVFLKKDNLLLPLAAIEESVDVEDIYYNPVFAGLDNQKHFWMALVSEMSEEIYLTDYGAVQLALTFDNAPTANSNNPVKSNGIKTALDEKISNSEKGVSVATLISGKVPTSQLPSYVSDIVNGYYNEIDGNFYEDSEYEIVITPELDKIYIDLNTEKTYRWNGDNQYVEISASLALGETSQTAYAGDKGKANRDNINTLNAQMGRINASVIQYGNKLTITNPNGNSINFTPRVIAGAKPGTTVNATATAEGSDTTATGSHTHAEGFNTNAIGDISHAEGQNTTAQGLRSHVEGDHTIAKGENQHVFGKYNILDNQNKYVEIVGNGTAQSPSNARTLDWEGNEYLAGKLTVRQGLAFNNLPVEEVSDKTTLQTKLNTTSKELKIIVLINDIDFGTDKLTFNSEAQNIILDLNGHNLYVSGLVNYNNQSNIIVKHGGKLWANTSSVVRITEASMLDNWSNIFAAYEALVGGEPLLDGVKWVGNDSISANIFAVASLAARSTFMPNAVAAGAFNEISSQHYLAFVIPASKTLDLNGKTLKILPATTTLGEGTITGATITLYPRSLTGEDNPLENAMALIEAYPNLVNRIYFTSPIELTTDYIIPSGVTIGANANMISGTVVFAVTNEADFTRTGLKSYATDVKLVNDITLSDNINLNSKNFDFNGHFISNAFVTTTGEISYTNGGGYKNILEEIERIDIAEETIIIEGDWNKINRNKDLHNNLFKFDEAWVKIEMPSLSSQVTPYINFGPGSIRFSINQTPSTVIAWYHCLVRNNSFDQSLGLEKSDNIEMKQVKPPVTTQYLRTAITSIGIQWKTVANLPEGTIITIYGSRI